MGNLQKQGIKSLCDNKLAFSRGHLGGIESRQDRRNRNDARVVGAAARGCRNQHRRRRLHSLAFVKSRELTGNPYRHSPRAISSQADQEWAEGSTTRVYGPDRAKRLHERGTLLQQRRYSLSCAESAQMQRIKSLCDNKLDDATFSSLTSPARFGNYLQILSKTFLVSDTLEAVKKAGRGSEVARGAMVKMRELKRDLEFTILNNQPASAGGATTGRAMGGMEMWLSGYLNNAVVNTTVTASTAVRSTTTANTCTTVPITSGVPGATAPTDGTTTAALTITNLNLALQGAWSNGGNPSVILATANNKTLIDSFTSIATRMVDVDASTQSPIIGAANVYISDYGRHTVVLNRYGRTSVLLCIDPNYWALAFLRRPMARELARTGDGYFGPSLNCVNCWDALNACNDDAWAISSQAA